jgi:2-haloacid dehalogenase
VLRAVLFDVNGTLTDTSAIGEPWGRPDVGDRMLERAVSTAMVDAILRLGGRTFADHLQAAVEVVSDECELDPDGVERALALSASLPARSGAPEALEGLRDAGLRLVALTNSGAEAGRRTLEECGLARFFDVVLGVDAVNTFKPDPAVYAHAVAELAEEPVRVALVATHPWDLAGAAHCGLATGWVTHGARLWPAVFPPPDVRGDSLPDLAGELLAHHV